MNALSAARAFDPHPRLGAMARAPEAAGSSGPGGSIGGAVPEVSAAAAHQALTETKGSVLLDVRSAAEWTFVGLPDVDRLARVQWQTYPGMAANPDFIAQAAEALAAAGRAQGAPVYVLCRSGGRSRAAAQALIAAGLGPAINVAGGFEGDLDPSGHRGTDAGWKAAGLPWRQS